MSTLDSSCADFRSHLARALEGRLEVVQAPLEALAWHAHLAGCAECSELLASEQVLEDLLASLPQPCLAPELARRVLLRLERERLRDTRFEELLDLDQTSAPPRLAERVLSALASRRADPALDALLDSVPAPQAPPQLAERVLAALEPQRLDPVLDALLEAVPAPDAPAGLAQRVLARAELPRARALERSLDALLDSVPPARAPAGLARRVLAGLAQARVPAEPSWRRHQPWIVRLAASLLLLAGGSFAAWRALRDPQTPAPVLVAAVEPPPEGLLETLDLLESWELVHSDDLDVLLASLESFDQELMLLELESEVSAPEPLPPPPAPEKRNG